MTRSERVVLLLETYNEARDGDGSLGPSGEKHGTRMNLHGTLWHSVCHDARVDCVRPGIKCLSPYAELERALATLKAQRPSQYFHVCEYYLRAQRIPKDIRTGTKIDRGKAVPVFTRKLVTTPNPVVRLEKVRRAVDFLATTMTRVELPAEYRDPLADRRAA